ncbi:MAG TPA: response regulator [Parasegetibacter sp.]
MIRVLIIEDEIIIARFIEQQLQEHFNCDTRIALSSNEARELMSLFQPHLVLTDINLREVQSGIELIKELQNSYIFEVIYITSYQHSKVLELASGTNPANFLVKPVDEEQLVAGVGEVIRSIDKNSPETVNLNLPIDLKGQELKVVKLMSRKNNDNEIASLLGISTNEVNEIKKSVCTRLNIPEENFLQLQEWAVRHRMLL